MLKWMSGGNCLIIWRNNVPLAGIGNCNIITHLTTISNFNQDFGFSERSMVHVIQNVYEAEKCSLYVAVRFLLITFRMDTVYSNGIKASAICFISLVPFLQYIKQFLVNL